MPTLFSSIMLAVVSFTTVACGGDAPAANGASPLTLRSRTPEYRVDVVREYPHDTLAFTQGLVWLDSTLYESTGQVGASNIRRVDLNTGKVEQQTDLRRPHFGEGIAILGDSIFQLTWTSKKGFIYDRSTFEELGQFPYAGEGWGLTTDGSQLIMSSGTPVIRFLDPTTLESTRELTVTENGTPVKNLNELEWVKGELWANVWTTEKIARIDPTTGSVIGWINLTGLLPEAARTGREDVLNGVAYDAVNDRIFVTGKYWPRLYEIRLRAPL